jgi:parvulin-like peptidyl-prolyl isomerase
MERQEPERITIQHVLVSFKETPVQADRTKEEAESLAGTLLEQARGGADFDALVREHSDDPVEADDPEPGVYRLINNGVEGMDFGQMVSLLNEKAAEREQQLRKAIEGGELAVADAEAQMQAFVEELRGKAAEAQRELPHPRAAMVPAFGDIGFALEPGEIGVAGYDDEASPFGWHVIRRID